MPENKIMGWLHVEERLKAFRFLLAHPDMTHFILPMENAHDFRAEMESTGGDVIAIDCLWLQCNEESQRYHRQGMRTGYHGYLGAAGYKTFEQACTAMTGHSTHGRNRMHRHSIITREGLQKVTADAEIERVKIALYS